MDLFRYKSYQKYLAETFAEKDGEGRGFRSRVAEHMGVQRAFISQVLAEKAHLNLEHADSISELLGHTNEEADFFLTLVLYGRAGNERLKNRLMTQMEKVREKRRELTHRFKEKEALTLEDKVEYYSSWLYGAIRVLITIPEFQTRDEIVARLKVSREEIETALAFLLSRNLIEEKGGRLKPLEGHLYLARDSKLIAKHHTNWRLRAIGSLDLQGASDTHFSAVNSLSRADVEQIRETLATTLESIRERVRNSPEEALYCLCLDFFEV